MSDEELVELAEQALRQAGIVRKKLQKLEVLTQNFRMKALAGGCVTVKPVGFGEQMTFSGL